MRPQFSATNPVAMDDAVQILLFDPQSRHLSECPQSLSCAITAHSGDASAMLIGEEQRVAISTAAVNLHLYLDARRLIKIAILCNAFHRPDPTVNDCPLRRAKPCCDLDCLADNLRNHPF